MRTFSLVLLSVFFSVMLSAQILAQSIQEDFEGITSFPSDDWSYHTCYNPSLVPGIDTTHGHPGHCYVPGGAGNGQNTELYHNTFLVDYSNGCEMSCDFFISDTSSHYTDLAIGLPRIPVENGTNLLYSLYISLQAGAGNRSLICSIDSEDPDHREVTYLNAAFSSGNWYRVKLRVRSDHRVEFYLDDVLMHTTTETIDMAYNNQPPVLHGFNAQAVYADNFSASYCEPLCENFTLAWAENFESYDAGTYPSTGGWSVKWSGQSAEVTDTIASEGSKSFKQTDGASFVRGDLHSISYNPAFKISVDYRRDVNETGSAINLWNGSSDVITVLWIAHTTREFMIFGNSTGVYYELGQWTNIEIEADFTSMNYILYLDGVCIQNGSIPTSVPYDQIEFSTGNNPGGQSCYWDDIRFYQCLVSPTPTQTSTPPTPTSTATPASTPCSFFEDFESIDSFPSDDWSYHTCYNPSLVPGIDTTHGHPGHCYVPGGAGNGQNTEIYHNTFLVDYSNGCEMSCDFFISDTSSHYTDLAIGLPRIPIEDGTNLLYSAFLALNSAAGVRNLVCLIDSDDDDHKEEVFIEGAFSSGNWYRVKLRVRSDHRVEFYLDDVLMHTTTETIDMAYNNQPPVLHGFNAQAVYADNFSASYCEPLCENFTLAWAENFESYDSGSYPSTGGWSVKWSGQSAEVTDTAASDGSKSFKQTDGASFVRGDLHSISYNPAFKISVDYRRDVNETGSAINLWNGSSDVITVLWIAHTTREFMIFGNSTGVYYELGQWTNIEIEADFTSMNYILYLDGVCIQNGSIPTSVQYDQIEFSTGNNPGGQSCYWDDIRFYQCNITPTPTQTSTPTATLTPINTPTPTSPRCSFFEDFESIDAFPSDDWSYHTCYNPSLVPGIDTTHGHPGHCYVPGGAGNGQNTEIYHNTFRVDYSNGCEMSCDFFISDTSSHYTDLAIGLPRIPIEDGTNLLYSAFLALNSAAGVRNLVCLIDSDDDDHKEEVFIEGAFSSGNWYRVKLRVRSDHRVEFYLDDVLMHTTTETIDMAYNNQPPVLHGFNAQAVYADNFSASYCEPLCETFTLAWAENFESYDSGSYPSTGGWSVKWSGQSAEVTDTAASEGSKSFKQTDGASFVRGDLHSISYNPAFKISVDYRRDVNETGSAINLWNGSSDVITVLWIAHTTREFMIFGNSTGVYYELGQWTNIEIEADFTSMNYILYLDGVCIRNGSIPTSVQYDQIEFSTGNNPGGKSCYWDDIRFYQCNITPTPTPLASVPATGSVGIGFALLALTVFISLAKYSRR